LYGVPPPDADAPELEAALDEAALDEVAPDDPALDEPPPTTSAPCIPACRWPGIGQKNVYLPAWLAFTLSVAEAPGAMSPVLTTPLGVCTDSAWVTLPVFLTVIVIVPV